MYVSARKGDRSICSDQGYVVRGKMFFFNVPASWTIVNSTKIRGSLRVIIAVLSGKEKVRTDPNSLL